MFPRRLATRVRGRGFGTAIAGPNGVAAVAADGLVWGWDAASLSLVPTFGTGTPTITRAGDTATRFNSSGLLEVVNANLARFTYGLESTTLLGLLSEEARTNVVLHNRDLTNAAWVASNVTPLKDQTGIDGVANSASRITATAGNGTILQSITLASSARYQTAYVRRLVGTGTVEMTMDNGATWAAITVTSSWTRVSIPTQTLANPIVGFRIVTDTDSIAVDVVQNENGAFATSAILTTTGSVARAADVITLATSSITGFSASTLTMFGEATTGALTGAAGTLASLDDGTANERVQLFLSGSAGNAPGRLFVGDGGVSQVDITSGGSLVANTTYRLAAAVAANDAALYRGGTSIGTDTSVTMPTPTTLRIGAQFNSIAQPNASIRKVRLYNVRKNNAQLAAMTAAS